MNIAAHEDMGFFSVVNLLFVFYLFHVQTVVISALCLSAYFKKNVDIVPKFLQLVLPEFKIGPVSCRLTLGSVCCMFCKFGLYKYFFLPRTF